MTVSLTTNPNPVAWAVTVGLANQLAIPAGPSRSGLVFINPGSVPVAICPASAIPIASGTAPAGPGLTPGAAGNTIPGVAVVNGAGSITMQPGDKFIIDNMNCSCAWNAIAAAPGPGALTILEML